MTNSAEIWGKISGGGLQQGDLLEDLEVPFLDNPLTGKTEETAKIAPLNLIMLTQSCDLENQKIDRPLLAEWWTVGKYKVAEPFGKDVYKSLVAGRRDHLYLLHGPGGKTSDDCILVDFRRIHSLHIRRVTEHAAKQADRWRLNSPYVEHLSQAFARVFMRVALPEVFPDFG